MQAACVARLRTYCDDFWQMFAVDHKLRWLPLFEGSHTSTEMIRSQLLIPRLHVKTTAASDCDISDELRSGGLASIERAEDTLKSAVGL